MLFAYRFCGFILHESLAPEIYLRPSVGVEPNVMPSETGARLGRLILRFLFLAMDLLVVSIGDSSAFC
jgi:hypothetical protein